MPSNIIQINGDEKLTWFIPDSQMEEIIKAFNKYGEKEEIIFSDASSLPYLQSESQS